MGSRLDGVHGRLRLRLQLRWQGRVVETLSRGLARPDAESIVSQVLDPAGRAGFGPDVLLQVQVVMASVLREIYLVPVLCAAVGLALVVWKFPAGSVHQLGNAPRAAGAIGESDEEERCRTFLLQLEPDWDRQ